MIWKKDKLRPTQPYFVLNTANFRQEVYLQQGISHFYAFDAMQGQELHAVPDACIDLLFEYREERMDAYACGTVLEYTNVAWTVQGEIFGVRFLPAYQPAGLHMKMKELIGEKCLIDSSVIPEFDFQAIAAETDFYQKIRVFLNEYTKLEKKREKPFGKRELVQSVKNLVYQSDGKIKVSELQNQTGYTDRYINKVFIEEMGFSPKTFCKIIQFQRALEFLNYGAPDKMTEAAVYLGYYDQPQFIRDFKRYAGITPKNYLKLIQEKDYTGSIVSNI